MKERIYLSPPHMDGNELKCLRQAYESNWIAPLGPQVDMFEVEMAKYIGIKNTLSLNSGTSALHLGLKSLGIEKGDNVLCPTLTFVATANAILYENANPIFLDSENETWLIDLNLLEDTIKKFQPKILITVDLYGQSCDYDSINYLCNKYKVKILEDAAEALGSSYKRKKCGSFGDAGILSFNGNKIITTSAGGMLLSNNKKIIDKSRFFSNQARENFLHYEHKELGYNYRMSNLLAAIGRGQLEKIDVFVSKRKNIFKNYYKNLSKIEGIDFMAESPEVQSNRWLTTFTINPKIIKITRDQIIEALEKENIESRPVWKPLHLQPLFKNSNYIRRSQIDVSKNLFENGICLPSGSSLLNSEQFKIIDIITSLL